MSRPLVRDIAQIPWVANGFATIQMPRGFGYRKLSFLLKMTGTRGAGNAGEPRDVSGAQYIRNIQLKADGQNVPKSLDLETMHRLTQIRRGTRNVPYVYAAGHGADAGRAILVQADLDFCFGWDNLRPMDGVYDTSNLTTLDLLVTFGAGADTQNTAYDGAMSAESGTLYVRLHEEVGLDESDRQQAWVVNEYSQRTIITASNTKLQLKLNPGNFYQQILIKTSSLGVAIGNYASSSSNCILNAVSVKAGTDVFFGLTGSGGSSGYSAKQLQLDNKSRYKVEAWPDGYYIIDFTPDGHLASMLDARKFTELVVECDVNYLAAGDTIELYPVELWKPALAAAGK